MGFEWWINLQFQNLKTNERLQLEKQLTRQNRIFRIIRSCCHMACVQIWNHITFFLYWCIINASPISTTHRNTIVSKLVVHPFLCSVYAKVKKSSKWVKIGSASSNFLNLGELGNFICHLDTP